MLLKLPYILHPYTLTPLHPYTLTPLHPCLQPWTGKVTLTLDCRTGEYFDDVKTKIVQVSGAGTILSETTGGYARIDYLTY